MIEYKPKKLEILVDGYWRPVYKIVLDEVGFMNRDLIMTDFRYIEEVPEVAEIPPPTYFAWTKSSPDQEARDVQLHQWAQKITQAVNKLLKEYHA